MSLSFPSFSSILLRSVLVPASCFVLVGLAAGCDASPDPSDSCSDGQCESQPALDLHLPPATTAWGSIPLNGFSASADSVSVFVNGEEFQTSFHDQRFCMDLPLVLGKNQLRVRALSAEGESAEQILSVVRSETLPQTELAPSCEEPPYVQVITPDDSVPWSQLSLRGWASLDSTLEFTVNGELVASLEVGAEDDEYCYDLPLSPGENTIEIESITKYGVRSGSLVHTVRREGTPSGTSIVPSCSR